jgi:hypothetical protein
MQNKVVKLKELTPQISLSCPFSKLDVFSACACINSWNKYKTNGVGELSCLKVYWKLMMGVRLYTAA